MLGDDKLPPTFWHAVRSPEFSLLVVTAIAGAARGSWWVFVSLCVAGLSISSLPKYIRMWPRARDAGAEAAWWQTVGLSTFNNVGAATAAYFLGIATRWLFG